MSTIVHGFITCAALIIAIGAQNAFLLAQGVRRNFTGPITITCISIDVILITLGVAGMGMFATQHPEWLKVFTLFGAIFLTIYGAQAFLSAVKKKEVSLNHNTFTSAKTAVIATLAVSLLNPHVYLDTVVLIGSIGSQHGEMGKWWFTLGAASASVAWFNLLAWGANKLSHLFVSVAMWRILDAVVCIMMWSMAALLWYKCLEI